MIYLMSGIEIDMEPYTPEPSERGEGNLAFPRVPKGDAYNYRDLPSKPNRELCNPWKMWQEGNWMLVRRIFGDELIRKLFYEVITFIWKQNHRKPDALRKFVVEDIFK